ncbi:hypothetical protein TNCV_2671321, partial [Trichonephila clavipes]
ESDVGYNLEVDLEYPSDLPDKHSDFPFAPENKPPPNSVGENSSTPPSTRKPKPLLEKSNSTQHEKNNSTQHEKNNSTQQKKTTQLGNRNEATHISGRNNSTQQ